jgi:predicted O-methyltransferase YrrM
MSLSEFMGKQRQRYRIIEGFVDQVQVDYLQTFIKKHGIRNVLEIGFNGGVSSAAMLSASPDVKVTSFDINRWDYVSKAKQLINETFPDRHTLIIGDSTKTVPAFQLPEGAPGFDMAFIDGGHQDPVPRLDILNTLPHLRNQGLIIMDDYCEMYGKGGVIQGYDDCVSQGLIKTIDGPLTGPAHRGWIAAMKL